MARSILTQEQGYRPGIVAGAYCLIAATYIVVSSYAVALLTGSDGASVEIAKGIGFVLITTAALWWLLKRQKAKSAHLLRTLRQILDNLGDGVFVVRLPERVIEYVNPAAQRIFGYDASSLVGRSTTMIHVDREHFDRFERAGAEALERDRVFVGNFRMRRANGEAFPTSHMVTTFRDDQGLDFSVSLVRDESQALLREKQRIQAQRLDAIAQLTGGVAHDFNNLLSVIMGGADALREDLAADDPRRRDAERVLAAAERAATLTRRLLSFAREQDLELELIDVNQLVRGLVNDVLSRTLGRSIEIVTRYDDQAALTVYADRSELERSLLNLSINARDAMPDGGRLTLETALETVSDQRPSGDPLAHAGTCVTIRVSDTGVGIPRETMGRIFEPFFSTKPKDKGTGLGLSGAYGFIRQSGGDIEVHSEENRGTTFTIRLPRYVSD